MTQQVKTFPDQTEVNLIHAQNNFESYGHHRITVELEFQGNFKKFSKITRNIDAVEESNRIDDIEQRQLALYQIIENDIEQDVIDWVFECEEQAEVEK